VAHALFDFGVMLVHSANASQKFPRDLKTTNMMRRKSRKPRSGDSATLIL
jgi:hypothetical protein